MHTSPTPLVRPYPHHPLLGRNMQLDARSLQGPRLIENVASLWRQRLRSVHWPRRLAILNQGALRAALERYGIAEDALGCCVAMATTGLLGTAPHDHIAEILGLSRYTDGTEAERATDWALAFYADCTEADPFAGSWPVDDTGTDGLTACKVAKARGLISSYRHASTLRGLVTMLQDGPVLLGVPWRERFFEPDRHHRIDPVGWADTAEAGGHEIEVVGVELWRNDPDQLDRAVFRFANSWGTSWAEDGYAYFGGRTYELLRSGIDVRQPLFGN